MPSIDKTAEEHAIRALNKSWSAAATAHDLEAVLAMYAKDGSLVWPGEPAFHGSEAIRGAWTEMMKTPGLALEFTSERIVVADSGDLASDFGKVAMASDTEKGREEVEAKYLVVWRKEGRDWKVLYDAYNMNSQ